MINLSRKGMWKMNIIFCRTIFINILVLLIVSPSLAQESSGPRLVIEEKLFSANNVKEGDIIEHTFKVSNPGDETLIIERVNPG